MTLQQADSIVEEYLSILRDEQKRGARRSPALLPASKETLLSALKLLIAKLYAANNASEEQIKPLVTAAMFLDSFSDQALDTNLFVRSMQSRREEMQRFIEGVQKIPPNHDFFWQQIYSLAGVATDTKRTTVFTTIRQRLGLAPKSLAPWEQTGA